MIDKVLEQGILSELLYNNQMNICPCLQTFLQRFKAKKPVQSYQGLRQIQQEQFIHKSQPTTPSLSDTISPTSAKPQKPKSKVRPPKPIQQAKAIIPSYQQQQRLVQAQSQLPKVQLEINGSDIVRPLQNQIKDIEQMIQDELFIDPMSITLNNTTQMQVYPQHEQPLIELHVDDDRERQKFSINLDPLDPYYPILLEKTSNLSELFQKNGERMLLQGPNQAKLDIRVIQSPTNQPVILLNYHLRCSYSFYLSTMKNQRLFSGLSPIIDLSKTVQSYRPNFTLNTLKLKKIGSFQARDCYYIKYQNGSKNQHWQIYINKSIQEQNEKYKTCEIFCAKNIKQLSERELYITQYFQIDFQSANVYAILPKLVNQYKNFINKLSDHIDQNYEQQLA